jgi:hypothetical protein
MAVAMLLYCQGSGIVRIACVISAMERRWLNKLAGRSGVTRALIRGATDERKLTSRKLCASQSTFTGSCPLESQHVISMPDQSVQRGQCSRVVWETWS